jgi:hypothetical protein
VTLVRTDQSAERGCAATANVRILLESGSGAATVIGAPPSMIADGGTTVTATGCETNKSGPDCPGHAFVGCAPLPGSSSGSLSGYSFRMDVDSINHVTGNAGTFCDGSIGSGFCPCVWTVTGTFTP